ncbi:ATP-dependent DNA helicase [Frankliniella fusca]|uniref:ATP-dependent DNA helicase n=1 Tax=Frankliniella fusca TaxID=407009 RepID=A0AAE1L885_9NEOP|nr:ATP-dependent DNA helicase [Frankliniella fusca]
MLRSQYSEKKKDEVRKQDRERRKLSRLCKKVGNSNLDNGLDVHQTNFDIFMSSLQWKTCRHCKKRALMSSYDKLKYSGQVINFPQNVQEVCNVLPQTVGSLSNIITVRVSRCDGYKDFNVRKSKVRNALFWLKEHNPYFCDVEISSENLDLLPENGDVYLDCPGYDADADDTSSDKAFDIEGVHYVSYSELNEEELESIDLKDVPNLSGKSEKDKVGHSLDNNVLLWPSIGVTPINEFGSPGYIAMAFPHLFPFGTADYSNRENNDISLYAKILASSENAKSWRSKTPIFGVLLLTTPNIGVFQRQNLAFSEDAKILASKDANHFTLKEYLKSHPEMLSHIMYYSSHLRSTKSYWKNYHWKDLYRLLGVEDMSVLTSVQKSKLISDNPLVRSVSDCMNLEDNLAELVNRVQRHTRCSTTYCLRTSKDLKVPVCRYIAKYAAKCEVESNAYDDLLNNILASNESDDQNCKKIVRRLLITTCAERDYCAQEVMFILMGFPLYHSSRQFVILNLKESVWESVRTCEFQGRKKNFIEHYVERPNQFESLSLLSCARDYYVKSSRWVQRKKSAVEKLDSVSYLWNDTTDCNVVFEWSDSECDNHSDHDGGDEDVNDWTYISNINSRKTAKNVHKEGSSDFPWDYASDKYDLNEIHEIWNSLKTDKIEDVEAVDFNLLSEDQCPNSYAVLAYSAVAAKNVNGSTIHSFFRIHPKSQFFNHLNSVELQLFQEKKCQLKVLFIDEYSMVGLRLLGMIDQRCREAKDNDAILERVSSGQCTSADVKMLKKRTILNLKDSEIAEFKDCLRICSRKNAAKEHNTLKLENLNNPIARIAAENNSKKACSSSDEAANGLPNVLYLSLGSRIMLRQNINISLGLLNGSLGTVIDIVYKKGCGPPQLPLFIIIIKFDDFEGFQSLNGNVPISVCTATWYKSRSKCTRVQYPLSLSWACTVHKSQSLTLARTEIDLGDVEFQLGLTYVALSRMLYINECDIFEK